MTMPSPTTSELCKLFFDYLNTYSKSQHPFNRETWCMIFDFNYQSDNILFIHVMSFETLDVISLKCYLKTTELILSIFSLNSTMNIINCRGADCQQFDNVSICSNCCPMDIITHIDILDQFYCIDEDNHIIITNSSVSTPEINEHYISEIFNTYVDSSYGLTEMIFSEENKQMFINKILSQINNTDIHTGPEPIALPIPLPYLSHRFNEI